MDLNFLFLYSSYMIQVLLFWIVFYCLLPVLNAITIYVKLEQFFGKSGLSEKWWQTKKWFNFKKQILKQVSKGVLLICYNKKIGLKVVGSSALWSWVILPFFVKNGINYQICLFFLFFPHSLSWRWGVSTNPHVIHVHDFHNKKRIISLFLLSLQGSVSKMCMFLLNTKYDNENQYYILLYSLIFLSMGNGLNISSFLYRGLSQSRQIMYI